MTTGRINQVCTQPLFPGKPKPTRDSSSALKQSTRLQATLGDKHQCCNLSELTLRHCSARHEAPQKAALRLRHSGLVRCAHAALWNLTQWVLAFTETFIGSATRAPSFTSTCPLNNQDTLRADCPGARFTVNVFPFTRRGRAQRAPPCKNENGPLQIPAFSVLRRKHDSITNWKVCAFTRALFLRRREPTSLEQAISFDASSDWGGRGHKNLMA